MLKSYLLQMSILPQLPCPRELPINNSPFSIHPNSLMYEKCLYFELFCQQGASQFKTLSFIEMNIVWMRHFYLGLLQGGWIVFFFTQKEVWVDFYKTKLILYKALSSECFPVWDFHMVRNSDKWVCTDGGASLQWTKTGLLTLFSIMDKNKDT